MWYDNDNRELNFAKPIFATSREGEILLLVPQHTESGYKIKGYDWLRIKDGEYNSCCCFATADEAVKSYRAQNYTIVNGVLAQKSA